MNDQRSHKILRLLAIWKRRVWLLFIPVWGFGLIERWIAMFSDLVIMPLELAQVLTIAFFLFGWLLLKPNSKAVQVIDRTQSS